jgi:adenosylcobinamide-phosphate synthase
MVTPTAGTLAGRVAAVGVALVADRALGEPPAWMHPVAGFGQMMVRFERPLWADRRRAGVMYAASGIGVGAAAGALLSRGRPSSRLVALAGATYVAVASRALCDAAGAVGAALDAGDIDQARERLRSLVGRETARLDEPEIIRATVESVAENTVDAVTAPLLWAIAGGAAGVLAYRAVNTLDAMVGHRTPRYEHFGWAAARADDAANWLPARLTAAAVGAVRPDRLGAVFHAARTEARLHPSPNAGVVEAAFAAALGVRLGGVNDYAGRIETRPQLGLGAAPQRRDIDAACTLSRRATAVIWMAAMCMSVALAATAVRGRR